jgi:hypothetical protein
MLWQSLDGQSAAGYRAFPVEIVPVPKSATATRPAADLSTEDQLLYAALVRAIRNRVPDGLVSFTDDEAHTYEQFERFPLEQNDLRYVVEGDASAFFQYIDYELLAGELIGLTGWADAVESLVRLLQVWMGDHRGVPQGPQPSRVVGDIYIGPVARRLARAGWTFSRHTDDFRIVARTWREAREALLAFELALAQQRLVPATSKTRTYRAETYRRRVERANAPRLAQQVSRQVFEELAETYVPSEVGRFSVTPGEVVLAEHVMREQADLPSVDTIGTRLLRWSLGVLGNGASPVGLEYLRRLLDRHPHVTQAIAGYVGLLMGTELEGRAIDVAVNWLESPRFRLPWQIGWALHALAAAEEANDRAARVAERLLLHVSGPWFVHGQAALVSAAHGRLPDLSNFVAIYEAAPKATRPDLVAAVAIGGPRWANRFLAGATESPLLAAVARLDPENRREWL